VFSDLFKESAAADLTAQLAQQWVQCLLCLTW
jgi:hypothetical protein